MTTLNPDHFLEQAERLIAPPPAGPPRQVDLRRAISATYYGLFHFVSRSLADAFVGVKWRNSPRYALVYRSISHTGIKELCGRVYRGALPQKYVAYIPQQGFGRDLLVFASAVIELQEIRHVADYDPMPRFRTSEAKTAIATARSGIRRFKAAPEADKQAFLTLLLCPPR